MTQAWYPFYWSDYSGKTMHLTMGQHGAYMLFLRWIYTTGKPIPDKQRYSIARAMVEQEQADADTVLSEFFHLEGLGWVSHRASEVIEQTKIRHERRVNAGKKGGQSKASNARAMPEQSLSNHNHNHNHIDTNVSITPLASKPEIGLFAQFWDLYPRQRRGSKDKALASYKAALKRDNTEQQIIDGVKNYAASSDVTRGYAKGCAAWLNDDGFNNDYKPVGVQDRSSSGSNRGFDALATAAAKISENLDHEAEQLLRENPVLYFQRYGNQPGGTDRIAGSLGPPDPAKHDATPARTGSHQESGTDGYEQ